LALIGFPWLFRAPHLGFCWLFAAGDVGFSWLSAPVRLAFIGFSSPSRRRQQAPAHDRVTAAEARRVMMPMHFVKERGRPRTMPAVRASIRGLDRIEQNESIVKADARLGCGAKMPW
jgi:hypothetical protein